jgi:metal-sulfur cluster biosynthetic enzyme
MSVEEGKELHEALLARLRNVIDPETQVDVVRMRLVENLHVKHDGWVEYTFRPSSPFCPLAVHLASLIHHAISGVPGVKGQKMNIENYVDAGSLMELINKESE